MANRNRTSKIDPRTIGIPQGRDNDLPFSSTSVMEWLADHSKDDIWGGLGSVRTFMAVQHKELLNDMLLKVRDDD